MTVIETQHRTIPWRWVIIVVLLTVPGVLASFASNNFTFSLRKFLTNPALINGILSLDVLFNILVATTCLYLSDRIWTKRGRRIPFVVVAWLAMAVCYLIIPFASGPWVLVPVVVLALAFMDMGATFQTLTMEIVPPEQRGRASAMSQIVLQVLILGFVVVVGGRFDEVVHTGAGPLRGETFLYWIASVALIGGVVLILPFVRERPPVAPRAPETFSLRTVFSNILADRRLWPVYLLAACQMPFATPLGPIEQLLITEQWGYSKQDIGTNVLVGGLVNMAILPFIGMIADKVNRVKMFGTAVGAILLVHVSYFLFVQFVLPDRRPELWHIISFGWLMSICGLFANTAFMPLLFDYIPRESMGTAQAGLGVVRSVIRLVTMNIMGVWVTWYSAFMMAPGRFDYFSGYLLLIGIDLITIAMFGWFAWHSLRGRFPAYGKMMEGLVPGGKSGKDRG